MIPIQLTIEGLYSYQCRQTIDFDNLTNAGLFGIFGTVGSGKSSILEAITFALYAETERMNSKEKRAYNMMNLKSNKSHIEFEFFNHSNARFKVVRTFRRNSKNFDDVKPADSIFYEWKNENWSPLEHSNAEKIIGLSYTNFKRTIIIPQGQFKEFLELGAKDRTTMLREIYPKLNQFDLYSRTSILEADNTTSLNKLQGKLSGFEEVSEEKIDLLKTEVLEKEKVSAEIQEKYNSINTQFQQLKVLKEDFEKLASKKTEFEQAESDKIKIDEEEKQLKYYEKLVDTFQNILIEEQKIEAELHSKNKSIDNQKSELLKLEENLKSIAKSIETLSPIYDQLPTKRLEELDLENIISIVNYQKEISKLKQRTLQGIDAVEKVTKEKNDLDKSIKATEKDIKSFTEKRIDSQILISVGNWFSKQENLHQSLENQKLKIKNKLEEISQISTILDQQKFDKFTYKEDFEKLLEQLNIDKKKQQEEKSQLELQQKLAHYSDNLHNGEPCPLCGALEHPHIATSEDVSAQIVTINKAFAAIEEQENNVRKQFSEIQTEIQKLNYIETELNSENKYKSELEIEIKDHLKLFIWSNFDPQFPDLFKQKQKESLALEKEIEIKNEAIAAQRSLLEKAIDNVSKYEKALSEFQLLENEKQTQIQQNTKNLKVLSIVDFQDRETDDVENLLNKLKKDNKKIEEDFANYKAKQNELAIAQSAKNATIAQLSQDVEKLSEDLNEIKNQIKDRLSALDISTIEIVKETLSWKLNTSKLHDKIKNFQIQFQTLQHIIKDLELKFENTTFDENLFTQHQQQFENITNELKSANDQVAKTKAEIERLTKAFDDKKDLLVELEKIQKRADNLKVLSNLFKGAGFVQYVSSIYLRQLCDHANIRFHRMTRNQLSLQLNDQNDFEIIDYLNEGRSRSVKTLSGGQGFQVSLSLALALAESVQTNAKSDKNFFFIDEGFGTQDAESINIVFETLQSLLKENRIVGIISHVEELKERIPISLQINKDEERGSLIEIA